MVVAIPGARRPETARSAARAARLDLDAGERAAARAAFAAAPAAPAAAPAQRRARSCSSWGSRAPARPASRSGYVARGYVRLNRDERGGALRALADALDGQLAAGARRVVLDNTYLTRAARSYVIEAAGRHGIPTRCVWLDTPLAQAQVNMVERLLERGGVAAHARGAARLARREPGMLAPTSQMRALRELEPPSVDEGFARRGGVAVRPRAGGRGASGRRVRGRGGAGAARLASTVGGPTRARRTWSSTGSPDGAPDALARRGRVCVGDVSGPVEGALCPHGGGPPRCWCRPPLPGLPLAFAHARGLDPARCTVAGTVCSAPNAGQHPRRQVRTNRLAVSARAARATARRGSPSARGRATGR